MALPKTVKDLPNNNRFYVLVFAFLLSIFITCWLRLLVAADELYYLRLEQVFGFLSVGCLYISLMISPLQKLIGTPEWMKNVVFARRAIGVSALYFALLHTGVSLWGQIGGFEGLAALPGSFVWPLVLGAAAVVIFCIMAIASFDKMVVLLGYRRWKWLQRLVYAAGMFIVFHVWAIGAHFTEPNLIQTITFGALALLFGLESWRMGVFLAERYHWSEHTKYWLFGVFWLVWLVVLLGLVIFSRPAQAHMFSKDDTTNAGAILHISPDDDPIAGEPAALTFDIQSPPPEGATAKLTITDDQNQAVMIPANVEGSLVKAKYTFPSQGLYRLSLVLEQGGKPTHHFTQSQRVSRGIITNATVTNRPLWAEAGMWITVAASAAVAAIAFWRRKAIGTYSKL